jgi:hypothetical protein
MDGEKDARHLLMLPCSAKKPRCANSAAFFTGDNKHQQMLVSG